jgi:hypothetical protein
MLWWEFLFYSKHFFSKLLRSNVLIKVSVFFPFLPLELGASYPDNFFILTIGALRRGFGKVTSLRIDVCVYTCDVFLRKC